MRSALKTEWRRGYREEFRCQDPQQLRDAWCRLAENVIGFCQDEIKAGPGAVVTLFGGLSDEVDLLHLAHSKFVRLGWAPALFGLNLADSIQHSDEHKMDAYLIDDEHFVTRGQLGIWEPDRVNTPVLDPNELKVVLVPGLYFCEETGVRLGRGGGYFDRYLSRVPTKTPRVGVALEWQLKRGLPLEPHDQRMDWLVTEDRWLRCRGGSSITRPA